MKYVVLIMRIIHVRINMEDVRQEKSDEGPTLKLYKRFKQMSLNKKNWHTRQGIYGLSGLEKMNSIPLLEVKLLTENSCQG